MSHTFTYNGWTLIMNSDMSGEATLLHSEQPEIHTMTFPAEILVGPALHLAACMLERAADAASSPDTPPFAAENAWARSPRFAAQAAMSGPLVKATPEARLARIGEIVGAVSIRTVSEEDLQRIYTIATGGKT
jgi:hypothetical protein